MRAQPPRRATQAVNVPLSDIYVHCQAVEVVVSKGTLMAWESGPQVLVDSNVSRSDMRKIGSGRPTCEIRKELSQNQLAG